ncbi:hypothetical protein PIB30_102701 [Stylosanthes scabra]|uniref:Transposase MuDR plant domain-containing protein n=1 Tax=Stylosanthes scabra TaxID=79078 RepID=A0ABU6RYP0_9FABA|nr:hypothetical protein [Stylosanthes scabra]
MHALNSTQDEVESHQLPTRPSDLTDESFFANPVLSDEEIDPAVLSEQEAAAMNYFTGSSIAFTQPAISERYDCPTHLSSLNLHSMNEQVSHVQRAPDDDPTTEFEVGQEFQNKEAVLMGCTWMIRVSYRRKKEIWEVRRYNGPHSCMQTSVGQDYGRLDSKVIAQYIFAMVKADPTIAIRVLQRSIE